MKQMNNSFRKRAKQTFNTSYMLLELLSTDNLFTNLAMLELFYLNLRCVDDFIEYSSQFNITGKYVDLLNTIIKVRKEISDELRGK